MLAILPRISFNYLSLTSSLFILWFIGIKSLTQILPSSTATAIMFALCLIIFVKGWQFLENRNHATALFVSYIYYSRQRRDLKRLFATEPDEETLSTNIQWLEETANAFIDAAQEMDVEPIQNNES